MVERCTCLADQLIGRRRLPFGRGDIRAPLQQRRRKTCRHVRLEDWQADGQGERRGGLTNQRGDGMFQQLPPRITSEICALALASCVSA